MTVPTRQCARCPAMIEPRKYSATLCSTCRTEAHRSRQGAREAARLHPDERPLIDETAAAIEAELARLDALRLRTRFRGTV